MGRTLLPYSIQIDLVEARFKEFRRGLRKKDQMVFDRLMRSARMQLQAGVMASNPNPFDSIAMSMLIELQKQIGEAMKDIKNMQKKIEIRDNE